MCKCALCAADRFICLDNFKLQRGAINLKKSCRCPPPYHLYSSRDAALLAKLICLPTSPLSAIVFHY